MQIGMIGLGRMGGNMAKRLANGGHKVVGYDMSPESGRDVDSLEALVAALDAPPRRVGDGSRRQAHRRHHRPSCRTAGHWRHDRRRRQHPLRGRRPPRRGTRREGHPLHVDCGVSGGVWGIDRGYALMVGGSKEDFEFMRPIYETLKPDSEYGLVLAGPVGGGHFAKMVHNGVEYGMMQAFGEGFATMVRSDLIEDPAAVMTSWKDGSVVGSWLLDLLANAFNTDPTLASMPPVANESGEAKWMIEAALELGVPTPATTAALYARQTSRGGADDTLRVVSTMRAQFGGHVTKA